MKVAWIPFICFSIYIASSYAYGGKAKHFHSKCKADENEPWSYRGKNGPQFWSSMYPTCKGRQQSPISINTHNAVFDESLDKLSMNNYDIPVIKGTIENNGHAIQINITDGVDRTIYVNGVLYRLTQLHFHWGDSYYKGAEHKIDGMQYAMEMHLVHQNSKNEVAVVAVFFQEQKKNNQELQNIIKHLPTVLYKDMESQLKSKLNLDLLLPFNPSSFYRYTGSLTTPACDEGVTWSILPMPLPVGFNQMAEFRKLYSATKSDASWKCKLVNNFRPIQPLNKRTVFVST